MHEGYAWLVRTIPHFHSTSASTVASYVRALVAGSFYDVTARIPMRSRPCNLELLRTGGAASPADLVAPFWARPS